MINYGVFTVPSVDSSIDSYLHIIHSSTDGQGVFLNGDSLDSESWVTSYADDYAYLEMSVTSGYYEISSATPFSAMVSGVSSSNAGYMFNVDAGMILS